VLPRGLLATRLEGPVPVTVELSPGVLLAGKYRIERELGSGGMGAVFLAENVDLGRRVAIKVLHPQAAAHAEVLARFRQEARTAAAIGHPGIVDVLDLGRTAEGAEFIVMEHLRGETLGQRLSREERLPVADALEIARALADALGAAHDHGIVHRDLKPDNVFLVAEPGPAIKIVDFGISKLTQGADRAVQTATGAVLGTPMYMSPEQVNADRELGPAADLYALGAICYQMLGGRPPFVSGSWAHLLLQIVNDAPVPLERLRPGLPPALCELVTQLLAKTPAERPRSAREVRRRLDDVAGRSRPASSERTPLPFAETMAPEAPEAPDAAEALADTALPQSAGSDPALAQTEAADDVAATAPAGFADTVAAPKVPPVSPVRRLVFPALAVVVLAGIPAAIWLLRSPSTPALVSQDSAPVGVDTALPRDASVDARPAHDVMAADVARRLRPRPRHVRPRAPDPRGGRAPRDPLAPLPRVSFGDAGPGARR